MNDLATAPRLAPSASSESASAFDLAAAAAAIRAAAAIDTDAATALLHRALFDWAIALFEPHVPSAIRAQIDTAAAWSSPSPIEARGTEAWRLVVVQDGSRLSVLGRQAAVPVDGDAEHIVLFALDRAEPGPGRLVLVKGRGQLHEDEPIFGRPVFRPRWIDAAVPLPAETLAVIPAARVPALLERIAIGEELLHAALDLGILEGFWTKAEVHVTTRTRPWQGQSLAKATDDPHLLRRWGTFASALHAAQGLFEEATSAARDEDPEAAIRAVAGARAFLTLTSREILSGAIELLGASATSERFGFDLFWRDFSAHAVIHPPVWPLDRLGAEIVAKEGARP